jgi:hypothetical protein
MICPVIRKIALESKNKKKKFLKDENSFTHENNFHEVLNISSIKSSKIWEKDENDLLFRHLLFKIEPICKLAVSLRHLRLKFSCLQAWKLELRLSRELQVEFKPLPIPGFLGWRTKNFILSQMNLIVSKFITKLFFHYNDFLQTNCTSY